jgi:tetratricopeptide (TPR) repeat protein
MAWFAGLLLFIFTSGVQAQGMMWENFQTKAKAAVERGEYRDAKEYYRQSIEQFVIVKGSETAPSTLVMAMITMEYARVLQELGELPEATKQAMQGVALYSGSERPRLAAIRANVQLGQLYEAQGCYEEALTQYQQAMTMARRFTGGDPNGICAITMHLAHLAEAREQLSLSS